MRWSLRNQILVPLIAIQGVAIAGVTFTTARLAAERSERQIIDRLNGVIDTLGNASFPFTANVLAKMQGLSGAQFVAYADDGRVTDTSFRILEERPPVIDAIPRVSHVDTLEEAPTVRLDGVAYFAARVASSSRARGSSLLLLYPETSWRQTRWDAALPSLLLGIGSVVLMSIVTSWIAHRISARIERLQRQVARIAEGDFRQELDIGRGLDEVSALSQSINNMSSQLQEMRRTIEQTERTRLLAQLAAGLAHQLRNSLTGARMSVQLHAKRFPAPGGDQSLSVALRQLAITEEQVKGLLTLGRMERRAPVACDLGLLLDEVALLVGPSTQHAGVSLRVSREDGSLRTIADAPSLRAAVLNLTLNAIEAAGPGGAVEIAACAEPEGLAIEVRDNGAGPASELGETMADAFVTTKPEGVGLGLAVARQVAVEHDGRLSWMRADGETRFRLAIPRVGERPGYVA